MYNFKNILETSKEVGIKRGQERIDFVNGVFYLIENAKIETIYNICRDDNEFLQLILFVEDDELKVSTKKVYRSMIEKVNINCRKDIEEYLKMVYDEKQDQRFIDYLRRVLEVFFENNERISRVDTFKL